MKLRGIGSKGSIEDKKGQFWHIGYENSSLEYLIYESYLYEYLLIEGTYLFFYIEFPRKKYGLDT